LGFGLGVKDGACKYRGVFAQKTGKADLSKGYWNPDQKMWATAHFLEIIKQP